MSKRPAPRQSSLAGRHPAEPAAAPEVTPDRPPRPEAAAPAEQVEDKQPRAQPVGSVRGRRTRPKVSFYQHAEDTARVRGAIVHTMAQEGSRTLSDFINNAVMAEVERLETKYNNGRPFPPLKAGEMPQGRPMGRE